MLLMLTIMNLFLKKKIIRTLDKKGQSEPPYKKYLPASKEWVNSLYVFRKNYTRFLPSVHSYVFKYLRSYFNMININLEPEMMTRKSKKLRATTGRKVWISTPEIKHTSEKICITIYVYNRLYGAYTDNLDLLESTWGAKIDMDHSDNNDDQLEVITVKPNKIINPEYLTSNVKTNKTKIENEFVTPKLNFNKQFSTLNQKRKINIINPTPKFLIVRKKHPSYLGKTNLFLMTGMKDYYMNVIKWLKTDKLEKIQAYKSNLHNSFKNKSSLELLTELNILKMERYNYLLNSFKKELIYIKLKQKLLFTEFKFSEIYLAPVIIFLETIYGKKIEFNIVTLRRYHLSINILLQVILTKLKKKSSRGRHLKVVDIASSGIRTPILSKNKLQNLETKYITIQNIILAKNKSRKEDSLEKLLLINNVQSSQDIHKLVLTNLENKNIAGLFIKISGRLTKRYKAQRAIGTLRFRGSLRNVHSSYAGLSSVLSRGFANLNVEKTMIHSKNKIGAFGLTGWMANY